MVTLKIANYTVTKKVWVEGAQVKKELPYEVRESMVDILLNPQLKLRAVEVLKRQKIAEKILACTDDEIQLEDAEYEKLKTACETLEGWCGDDVELIDRILSPAKAN